jgi:hypothetical protein
MLNQESDRITVRQNEAAIIPKKLLYNQQPSTKAL